MSEDKTGLVSALGLTTEQFEEWVAEAKKKDTSLENFIVDAVEGHILRSEMISYLNKQAKHLPWGKKRS